MQESDVAALVGLLGMDSEESGLLRKLEALGIHRIIERRRGYGWIECKSRGISIAFKPWRSGHRLPVVLPANSLELVGIHLYRAGCEGYSEYGGCLENGVKFGDTRDQLEEKLGTPYKCSSGRGVSSVVKGAPIPEWLKYDRGTHFVHYQMDESGTLEMVTLILYDV